MRLLTFTVGGRTSFGALRDGGVVDLGLRLDPAITSIRALLEHEALARAEAIVEATSPDYACAEIAYRRLVPAPEKILCVGVNYPNRNEEYRDGSPAPAYPSLFLRTPGSLVGHLEPLVVPRESRELDYEGEIALVIGRRARRVPEARAHEIVAGVTCMNDGTVRDWVRHGKFNVTQGKNFEKSGAIGPWMVTLDEIEDLDAVTLTTTVNGEPRQADTSAHLLFPIRRLLAYITTFTELAPGDIIATGTPPGAGARFDPPRYLEPGDRVAITVGGVGTLANVVMEESA